MNIYLRVLQEKGTETYSDGEAEQLRSCLSRAPGIEKVKDIHRHPKGGYAVSLEGANESTEALVEHVSSHGFRLVF